MLSSQSPGAVPAGAANSLDRVLQGQVVDQDEIRARLQGFVELGQVVHFDLDREHARPVGRCPPGLAPGRLESASYTPQGGDVVVLHQDGVGQAHTVVGAASTADGILLHRP